MFDNISRKNTQKMVRKMERKDSKKRATTTVERNNRTITAIVSEREVAIIDQLVKEGYYCSRSDAIRSFVRYCIARSKHDGVIFK